MQEDASKRNLGIDSLRILLMFMICLLHVLLQGGVMDSTANTAMSHRIYLLFEMLCMCAVDGFAIISGFLSKSTKSNGAKLVYMWFQLFFYSFCINVGLNLLGIGERMSIGEVARCAFPITFRHFWYFTDYTIVLLVMPVLNRWIESLNEIQSFKGMAVILLLFSVLTMVANPFQLHDGYHALFLIALYCVGGFMRRSHLFDRVKTLYLVRVLTLMNLGLWILYCRINSGTRLSYYTSPVEIVNAMLLIAIFSRFKKVPERLVETFKPLVFGVYLLQTSSIVWRYIFKDAFASIASMDTLTSVICTLLAACGIMVVGMTVDWIRHSLATLIHLRKQSEKIVKKIDSLFDPIVSRVGL